MPLVTLANFKQFSCSEETTVLDAARAQGLVLEYSCRTGRCGVCKSQVISGKTQAIKNEEALTEDEQAAGYILTCSRTALEDVVLDIEDLGRLASIKIQTMPCRIDSIKKLSPYIVQVILRLPPKNSFEYISGQYIDIIAKNGIRRSYSIASAHSKSDKIELHIAQVQDGEMSQYWFNEAQENDLLRFEGPYGTFCLREKPYKNIIFLATGTGIAPVKSILEDIDFANELATSKKIIVYWGGRTPEDTYWQPTLNNVSIDFIPVLSRADNMWAGRRGYVQDAVIADNIDLTDSVIYACGSDAMIHSAQKLLIAGGLKKDNFYSDAFVSSK